MAEITLVAEAGRTTGSGASRRLRHAGRVPGVVYGHGMEPLSVSVGARDLRAALSAHGVNQVLDPEALTARPTSCWPASFSVTLSAARSPTSTSRWYAGTRSSSAEVPLVIVGTAARSSRTAACWSTSLTSLSIRTTPGQHPPRDHRRRERAGGRRRRSGCETSSSREGVTTDADPDEAVVIAAAARVAAEVAEAAEERRQPRRVPRSSARRGRPTGRGGLSPPVRAPQV